jgi:hypothetical protein
MINLTISGKVGQDAKQLENGCVFSIASTKKGYTTNEGRVVEDKTLWVSVFAHKNLAPYINKGDSLTIYTDDIKTEVYEGKCNLSCYAVSVEFGGKSNQSTPKQNEPPF